MLLCMFLVLQCFEIVNDNAFFDDWLPWNWSLFMNWGTSEENQFSVDSFSQCTQHATINDDCFLILEIILCRDAIVNMPFEIVLQF